MLFSFRVAFMMYDVHSEPTEMHSFRGIFENLILTRWIESNISKNPKDMSALCKLQFVKNL